MLKFCSPAVQRRRNCTNAATSNTCINVDTLYTVRLFLLCGAYIYVYFMYFYVGVYCVSRKSKMLRLTIFFFFFFFYYDVGNSFLKTFFDYILYFFSSGIVDDVIPCGINIMRKIFLYLPQCFFSRYKSFPIYKRYFLHIPII